MIKEYRKNLNSGNDDIPPQILNFAVNKTGDTGKNLHYLIATGNLRSKAGYYNLGLVLGPPFEFLIRSRV